jgi:hypothetical protein
MTNLQYVHAKRPLTSIISAQKLVNNIEGNPDINSPNAVSQTLLVILYFHFDAIQLNVPQKLGLLKMDSLKMILFRNNAT